MTLKELRDAAVKLLEDGVSPDTRVDTEGCDCVGPALVLEVWTSEGVEATEGRREVAAVAARLGIDLFGESRVVLTREPGGVR